MVSRTRADRLVYLDLLCAQATFAEAKILASCLTPNSIHRIAAPLEADSLAVMLRRVHGWFAQYSTARRLRSGHLWQNWFFSCPMGLVA